MPSVIQICNQALSRIGSSQGIGSLDEASLEAAQCRLFYETTRDFVLRDYDWNFARRRITLAVLTGDPPTNWDYQYAYPSDCLAFRRIVFPGQRIVPANQKLPYEVANDGEVLAIYTDVQSAEGIYTKRVEDPSLFDAIFISALSYLLAAEIAIPLTGKPDIANTMRNAYVAVVGRAAAANLNEAQEGPEPEAEAIRARG